MSINSFPVSSGTVICIELFNVDLRLEEAERAELIVDASHLPANLQGKVFMGVTGNSVTVRCPYEAESFSGFLDKVFSSVDRIISTAGKPGQRPFLVVRIPAATAVNLRLSGSCALSGKCPLGQTSLRAYGSVEARLAEVTDADVLAAGSATINIDAAAGWLKVDLNGSANLTVKGTFTDVDVAAKGACDVHITGDVSGSFKGRAYGACDVTLRGSISGRADTSTAGASRIVFEP